MKNNFITKIIGATLAFAMMIGGAVGINAAKEAKMVDAETSSITFSNEYNANTALDGVAIQITTGLTVTFNKASGSNGPQYYTNGTAVRWYPKNTMVLSSTVGNITSVTVTYGGSDGSNTISANTGTWVSPTWTGEASSVTFTVGGSNGNRRIAGLSVTYGEAVQIQDAVSVTLDKENLNLDLYNDANTGSLTATATKTGNATLGLTAVSSDETVATVSTSSPTSGTAFTVIGHSVGSATITVTSTWDDTKSDSCTVTVVDSTPTYIDMKKINSLQAGQHVLIVTVVNNSNYYALPATTLSSGNPDAVLCTYDSVSQKLTHVDDSMLFTVGGENNAWTFTNSQGKHLYITNSNTGIRVNDTEDSFTVSSTDYGFSVKDNTNNRYLGKYKDGDHWRSYTSATADNFKGTNGISSGECVSFWVEAKLDQTITGVSSAYTDETVTLTSNAANPTWSIVAGDTTAEGAQVTAAGVVSATGAGTVKVKAAHADYEDAFHTITFSVRPSESYINVEQDSVSGFTGLHETLEFDFGNIDNPATAINVVSSNTSIVTVNAPSIGATTGSVQINFVGAGTTTVKFNEGEEEKDSVTVTVTQSSVSITGMPATSSVFAGNTLNLGSQVTVTATGSCSNAVTWESDNENVATVTDAGVVTGVAQGTANITITSVSNDNVSATCAVTVSRILFTNTNTIQNGKRYILATSNNYYLPAATQTVAENPAASHFDSLNELQKADAWYATVDAENHIVFSNTIGNETFYLNAKDAARGIIVASTASGYWMLDNDGYLYHSSANTRFLAAYNNADFRYYAKSNGTANFVTTYYEYIPTAKEQVEETKTLSALTYEYQQEGETYTFDNVAMRFGGFISQTLWNQLGVVQYGVLLTESEGRANSIEEDYEAALELLNDDIDDALEYLCGAQNGDTDIRRFYSSAAPTVATDEQKAFNGINTADVYYTWTIRKNVTNALTTYYSAVAYVRTATEIIFLEETSESAKHLATAALARTSQSDPAYASLEYFAAN